MIEIRDYKYSELCELMGEKKKTGRSKQLQLENWKRYFKWENPTKQIFRVIEVFETPIEKIDRRGGFREGAGAKVKGQEEFDVIFPRFLFDSKRKDDYLSVRGDNDDIYFSNDVINKYFGVYRNIYEALQVDKEGELVDKNLDREVYDKVVDKLREKSRSWIFNKIQKKPEITLTDGILVYYSPKVFERRDDLLPVYNDAQAKYMLENQLKTIKSVIDTGKWNDMQTYIKNEINHQLPEGESIYYDVKKYHKIIFEESIFDRVSLDFKKVKEARKQLNEKVISEVYNFFLKKEIENEKFVSELTGIEFIFEEDKVMANYNYILEKYIRLPETL